MKRSTNRDLMVLTALAPMVELLLLSRGLRVNTSLVHVCVTLTCYQAGYLVADFVRRLGQNTLRPVTAGLMLLLGVSLIYWSWIFTAVLALAFSAALQAWRRSLKPASSVTPKKKNTMKAIGMAAGGLGALPNPVVIGACLTASVVLLIACRSAVQFTKVDPAAPTPGSALLLLGESVHHAHYFAYAYVMWARIAHLPLPLMGMLFIIGWIGYFLAEYLVRDRHRIFSPKAMALGHAVCSAAICAMVFTTSLAPTMLLWFTTGLAGGTAFMLGNGPQHPNRERFEDLGHVVGIGGAALVLAPVGTPVAALWLAVVLAAIAAAIFVAVPTNAQPLSRR